MANTKKVDMRQAEYLAKQTKLPSKRGRQIYCRKIEFSAVGEASKPIF